MPPLLSLIRSQLRPYPCSSYYFLADVFPWGIYYGGDVGGKEGISAVELIPSDGGDAWGGAFSGAFSEIWSFSHISEQLVFQKFIEVLPFGILFYDLLPFIRVLMDVYRMGNLGVVFDVPRQWDFWHQKALEDLVMSLILPVYVLLCPSFEPDYFVGWLFVV